MIINNDKCKRSDRFKEIATILLEFVVEGKLDAFSFVAEFMIQYGNLKQMYLAKHFYMAGQFNGFSK